MRRERVEMLINYMLRFSGPILVTPGVLTTPDQMIDIGTYSLIDTGRRRLLVTCQHVWRSYLDERHKNPSATLALNLGDAHVIGFNNPESQLIDSDEELDLAVFDVSPEQIRTFGTDPTAHKEWFQVTEWPIPLAADGDYMLLIGYPGKHVRKDGIRCTMVAQPVPLKASAVRPKEIWAFNEGENKQVFAEIKSSLGGLSGSPAFVFTDSGPAIVGFVRGGFKPERERADNPDSLFSGTLILSHANCLNKDGRLTRYE